MIKYKYGEFTEDQFEEAKMYVRKQIYALLLFADPNLSEKYKNYDLNKAFDTLLRQIGGMNSVLREPPELVRIVSLLEAAWIEYQKPEFDFRNYRKLILEAGNVILEVKESGEVA